MMQQDYGRFFNNKLQLMQLGVFSSSTFESHQFHKELECSVLTEERGNGRGEMC